MTYKTGDIINGVLIGRDSELYLASGNHMPLSYVTREQKIEDAAIEVFFKNLTDREAFAASLGASYIHLVAPDKHTVVRKAFPFDDYITPGDTMYARSQSFLFPKNELIALSENKRIYQKYDSHWTVHGAIASFALMLQSFGFSHEDICSRMHEVNSAVVVKTVTAEGDLGRKLDNPPSEPLEVVKPKFRTTAYSNGFKGNNGKLAGLVSEHPKAKGRFLAFGDSFLMLFPNIFAYFFKEVILCRTPFLHTEVATAFAPDFILTEAVERYLPRTLPDSQAPTFIDIQLNATQALAFSEDSVRFFGPSLVPANWHGKAV